MSLVTKHIARLKKAETKLERIAQNAVRDNVDVIVGILVEGQLHKGIMSDGGAAPDYKQVTQDFWSKIPPRPRMDKREGTPWNFDWTGSWIEGMVVKSENDGYSIFSRDGKTRMLEAMAGGRLTKLTDENNKWINEEIIKPELYKFVLNNLFSS